MGPVKVRTLLGLGLALMASGCDSCGSKPTAPTSDAKASAAPTASSPPFTGAAPDLSLPIGADIGPDGSAIFVAGLVAASRTIVLSHYDAKGTLVGVTDAFSDVDWVSGVELRVYVGTSGIAVAYRGPIAKTNGHHVRLFDPSGKPRGDAFDVDGVPCVEKDALITMDHGVGKIATHPLGGAAAVLGLASVPDAMLACGDAKAYLLDEGDDGLAVRGIEETATKNVAAGDGDDEPREHPAYTVGDELSLVIVTTGGTMKVVAPFDATPREVGKLHDDEDIVAVDGDAKRTFVVYSKDDLTRCGSEGLVSDVFVRVFPRDGSKTTSEEVIKAACDTDVGPFWTGEAGGKTVIAWGERSSKRPAGAPPVTALGYHVLGEPGVQHVTLSAEDVVFADCAGAKCWAATIERPTGTDGMAPGKARLVSFP